MLLNKPAVLFDVRNIHEEGSLSTQEWQWLTITVLIIQCKFNEC